MHIQPTIINLLNVEMQFSSVMISFLFKYNGKLWKLTSWNWFAEHAKSLSASLPCLEHNNGYLPIIQYEMANKSNGERTKTGIWNKKETFH